MRISSFIACLGLALLISLPGAADDLRAGGQQYSADPSPFPPCGLCWTAVDGSPFCGQDDLCGDLSNCTTDADCGAGFKCARDTCCGSDPVCVFAEGCDACVNPGVCGTFDVCEPPEPCETSGFPVCDGGCPHGELCRPDGSGAAECSCQDPMLVVLEYVRADVSKRGVMVSWKTVVEIDNAGFRVLKETTRGGTKVIDVVSPQVIHPRGSDLRGAEYTFLDASKGRHARGIAYYLEDIDLWGRVTRHGPVYPGGTSFEPDVRESKR